jgi:hypothetical protein
MTLMKIQFLTLLESHVFSNGVNGGDDKINLFSSLFLPAGRQGGRGQNPALSNGVY